MPCSARYDRGLDQINCGPTASRPTSETEYVAQTTVVDQAPRRRADEDERTQALEDRYKILQGTFSWVTSHHQAAGQSLSRVQAWAPRCRRARANSGCWTRLCNTRHSCASCQSSLPDLHLVPTTLVTTPTHYFSRDHYPPRF